MSTPPRSRIATTLWIALALSVPGCRTEYVDSRGGDLAVSPDRMNFQDWTALADRLAQEVVASGVLARYGSGGRPASMLINPVQNQTGEPLDLEAITKIVRIQFLATGRVQVITGGGAGAGAEDPIVAESRQRRRLAAGLEDPLEGVPDISARLRIFRDQVRVEGGIQSAYFLQMTLSDTATQRSVWEGQATVAKRGSKASIGTR